MATLTVDRYLDAAACTAGEAFTLNGGRLTIRTDSRWHANSPASMTGSLGSITCTDGDCLIDATQTRWLPITAGTGTPTWFRVFRSDGITPVFDGSVGTADCNINVSANNNMPLMVHPGGEFHLASISFTVRRT